MTIYRAGADNYFISTDKSILNIDVIHQFLSNESYWAKNIRRELIEKSIENSTLCYGIYHNGTTVSQVGFARVISDFVRFAWLGDVFILPDHRGRGLSKWLIKTITDHPYLAGTSFNLNTNDAHTLYTKYGFKPIEEPGNRLCRPVNWEAIHKAYQLENN